MYFYAGVGKTTLCSSLLCMSHVYAGVGKTTLCSSLLCMAMLVLERQRCLQVCCECLCWCLKDNVVFKFVMYV